SLHRHSRGAWGEAQADRLLAAAEETLALWAEELDYPDLADDIALEARPALGGVGSERDTHDAAGQTPAQVARQSARSGLSCIAGRGPSSRVTHIDPPSFRAMI